MKSALQTACFFLLFFFLFIICPSSCSGEASTDRSEYASSSFDASVRGDFDGIRISGTLKSRPDASESGARAVFCFDEPEALRGVVLTVLQGGEMSVRLGDTVKSSEALMSLKRVFEPVIEMGEVSSVRKEADGSVILSVCDENCDLEYTFLTSSALPSRIKGEYSGKPLDISIKEISSDTAKK